MNGLRNLIPIAAGLLVIVVLDLPNTSLADDAPPPDGSMTPPPIDKNGAGVPEKLLSPENAGEDEDEIDSPFAFKFLKRLEGEWQGSVSGQGAGEALVSFTAGANGTVLVETAFRGTEREMVSVYYLEGPDLTVTHFHPSGNQPRLRFDRGRSYSGRYFLKFAGGTGFDKSKDRHVHEGSIQFKGADRIVIERVLFDGLARAGNVTLDLRRSSATPAVSGGASPGK
jgi:hypothetical protein